MRYHKQTGPGRFFYRQMLLAQLVFDRDQDDHILQRSVTGCSPEDLESQLLHLELKRIFRVRNPKYKKMSSASKALNLNDDS